MAITAGEPRGWIEYRVIAPRWRTRRALPDWPRPWLRWEAVRDRHYDSGAVGREHVCYHWTYRGVMRCRHE